MITSSPLFASRFPIYLLLACLAWLLAGCGGGGGGGTSGTQPAAASSALDIELERNESTQSNPTANDECEHSSYRENDGTHDGFWNRIHDWFHDDDDRDHDGNHDRNHDDNRDRDRNGNRDDDHDGDDHHDRGGHDDDDHGHCTGAPAPTQNADLNADLLVTKSVDNAYPTEGDTVVYTVTVTNNGPSDATGVSLIDTLPAGLTYVSDDATSTGTSYSSGTGAWTVGNLANMAAVTLRITATLNVGTGGSVLTNTASVSDLDQLDREATNDSATADVFVAPTTVGGSEPIGLVHYWKLDETGGSSYTNFVGSNPPATCTVCPTPVAGPVSGAQQFDGTTNEINVADDNSFDWSSGSRFSVEAWIRRGSPCGITGETIIGRRDAASQLKWSLGCEGSNAAFTLIDASGAGAGADLVGSTDIADGKWHHVVAMRDAISGENLLYVDGVEEASASVSYAGNFVGSTDLNIGWLNEGGSDDHFAGVIDEVALHDRVLPDSEIRRHYADGTVGLQRGYWGCEAPVRIMPLGDSLTRRQGYRPGLYFDLIGAGMDVDMVGSVKDSCDPNCTHDPDNEGHSGWTATDIAGSVATWLSLNPPDVVTLHIGTNLDPSFPYPDVTQVGQILDQIKTFNADIPVVLARIINKARTSYDPQLSVYNQNMESLAQARIAAGDRILVVDQEPGLDYSDTTTDFAVGDDLHPTATGFAKMVSVWFDGLNRFTPACNDVAPQVISQTVTTATSGAPYVYVVEATGVPAPSFSLTTAPAGMTVHPDTGRIDWTPPSAGNYNVTLEVTNAMGSATQSFTLAVN